MLFPYTQIPTTTFGLKFRPTINPEADAADWIEHGMIDGQLKSMNYKHQLINPEFSDRNKSLVLGSMKTLSEQGKLNAIFEIGVNRSGEQSSTRVMLDNKPLTTKYFGVDLNPGCLDPIRDESKNVFCLCQNSSNIENIMNWCKSKGVDTFDLVHIDGWHSINQVMDDVRFLQHLRVGGIALFHDVGAHPGPHCVYDALDEEFFDKKKWFCEFSEDWGMAIAVRLK